MSITAGQAVRFSNISATTALFSLKGGKYAVEVVATFGGGSVKLQTLLPDGSTVASVSSTTRLHGERIRHRRPRARAISTHGDDRDRGVRQRRSDSGLTP